MSVNCAEWIVQEVDVCVFIEGSSELDPLLLPATQVDPSLSYLSEVTEGEHLEVLHQGAPF